MTETNEIDLTGAIDADGHILEPPDLWETYLEPRYRDRAIRFRKDDEGWECLEFDGQPSRLMPRGFAAMMGTMGQVDMTPNRERTYVGEAPHGSMDAKERVERLDSEGIAKAILYPTIGLLWEAEVSDPEISAAYCRAYNRWIVDFCSDSGGRLIPIAHLSLTDVNEAAAELERAVESGAKGAFFPPYTWDRKSHGHPDYDLVWAKAQDLGVPIGLHPAVAPFSSLNYGIHGMFEELAPTTEPLDIGWYFDVLGSQAVMQAFAALFAHGLFDRFPNVKVIVLESQAGWIGYLLDRMDGLLKSGFASIPLKELPSYYFQRQCWISADPDEKALQYIIDFVGAERFFWASDYPHSDHTIEYMAELKQLVAPLSETARRQICRENVARAFKLE